MIDKRLCMDVNVYSNSTVEYYLKGLSAGLDGRQIFYVDIGNLPIEKCEKYIKDLVLKLSSKMRLGDNSDD